MPWGKGLKFASVLSNGARVALNTENAVKNIATAIGISEELNRFNIIYNKKHNNTNTNSNNGNNRHNGSNSRNTNPKQRNIATLEDQIKYSKSQVRSGKWFKHKGRRMYEDKDGNRYIPTVEKYEFEVGAKVDGVWQHIGVLRPKGEGAGEILRKFGKGRAYGKAFE